MEDIKISTCLTIVIYLIFIIPRFCIMTFDIFILFFILSIEDPLAPLLILTFYLIILSVIILPHLNL